MLDTLLYFQDLLSESRKNNAPLQARSNDHTIKVTSNDPQTDITL